MNSMGNEWIRLKVASSGPTAGSVGMMDESRSGGGGYLQGLINGGDR